jgi:Caspase domain
MWLSIRRHIMVPSTAFPAGRSMRFGVFAVLLLILAAAHTTSASAERRVALVIGNSAYQNVPKLPNPVNDARAIAALLKNAGFDVVESRSDLGIANIRRAMRDFSNVARDADIGVVYYAGHGIEVDGTNYLIPVDAVLEHDVDVDDETLSVDRVMKSLEAVKRLRLVILDACRDNPFMRTMKRTIASRSVGRGLAKVEPTTSDTLIAFAAKAGSTAMDGNSKNSPFTTALVKYLATPGLDLRIAFGRVRDDVLKATSNQQEPFVYGSLGGDVVSLVPVPEPKVVSPTSTATDNIADMRRDYEFFQQVGTKEAWGDFLQLHPTGPYANLARARLAKLIDTEKKAADEAKAAEKAVNEKAAAERAAAEKRVAAETAETEKAEAKKAEADRLAAEKAMAEKAVAEKDTADKTAATPAPQSAEGVAAEKEAAVSPDTPSQTTKPTLPGPTKKITTQDKTPPTRIKVATRNVEKEDQTSSRRPTPTANLPTADTCTRYFTMCRINRSKKRYPGFARVHGSCEQRQTICLSSGRWTGPRGIHSVARR